MLRATPMVGPLDNRTHRQARATQTLHRNSPSRTGPQAEQPRGAPAREQCVNPEL